MVIDEKFWVYANVGGQLTLNGEKCRLKGINWAGFENKEMIVQCLWIQSMEDHFKSLAEIGVNAIRIPVSAEFMEYIVDDEKMKEITIGGNDGSKGQPKVCPKIAKQTDFPFDTDLDGQSPRHGFDKFMKLAYKYNMIVMVDNHSFVGMGPVGSACKTEGEDVTNTSESNKLVILETPVKNLYGKPVTYPLAKMTEVWSNFAKFLLQYPNAFACDIKNEPHGVTLATIIPQYEAIAAGIMAANPRVMIVVEGTDGTIGGWGNGFEELSKTPITKIPNEKLIYGPHQYGKINMKETTAKEWDIMYGHIKKTNPDACMMIGEWGQGAGHAKEGGEFATAYAEYIDKSGFDSFYWAYQFTSADTVNLTGKEGTVIPGSKLDEDVKKYMKMATPVPALPRFPPQQ
jgi:aryl-phospho-beta-D-glucosidase BglC (GH1 family)